MHEKKQSQIMGEIISVDMVPCSETIRGHRYSIAVIEYKPYTNNIKEPLRVSSYGAEWTKSRNFP